jgi:hypothetical protein
MPYKPAHFTLILVEQVADNVPASVYASAASVKAVVKHNCSIDLSNKSAVGDEPVNEPVTLPAALIAKVEAAFAAALLILLIPHRPHVYIAEAKPIGALLADPTRSPDAIEVGGIE